jgi:hypothetical protein
MKIMHKDSSKTPQINKPVFEACGCKPKYSIEPLDEGYVLYYGRCRHSHGYTLVSMTEPEFNFDPRHIERLINLGNAEYQKNSSKGYVAD